MQIIENTGDTLTIKITEREAIVLNNAVNEVCNGIQIHESEFHTRMGVRREEAKALLRAIHDAV